MIVHPPQLVEAEAVIHSPPNSGTLYCSYSPQMGVRQTASCDRKRGITPGDATSGGLATAADDVWKVRDGGTPGNTEPGAKIVPEGDAEFSAGLGEPKEGVAAVAAGIAVGSAADLALGHLAADVVLWLPEAKRPL